MHTGAIVLCVILSVALSIPQVANPQVVALAIPQIVVLAIPQFVAYLPPFLLWQGLSEPVMLAAVLAGVQAVLASRAGCRACCRTGCLSYAVLVSY